MAYLNNIDQVRKVQWKKSNSWDIKLEGCPSPFDSWFPAIDVQYTVAVLQSDSVTSLGFRVPKSTGPKNIRITFVDDEKSTLLNFFQKWMETVSPTNNSYTLSIHDAECTKMVHLSKLDSMRNEIKVDSYRVYPDGELEFHGDSDANLATYSLTLVVVGI